MTLPAHYRLWLFWASMLIINTCIGVSQLTQFWPAQSVVFVGAVLLPGAALLYLFRPRLPVLPTVLFSFGLGILVLMLGGAALNQLPIFLPLERPLETTKVWIMWNILTVALAAPTIFQKSSFAWPKFRISKIAILLLTFSIGAPTLAVFGAFRLNNGGDALVAMMAIVWIVLLIIAMVAWRARLSDSALAWGIFMAGLSILLMTSLRSWDITGHDFTREFHVYTITHNFAHWDIRLYRDPYNACLSITILPEIFARLMNVSGIVVFKVLMQIIFAACPVVIYMLTRRFAAKLSALVACGIFISYPTFVNDSAMLTRQGVAYLFFALALFVALRSSDKKLPKALFMLCAIGAIVSHYSTAYMFVALFVLALLGKWLLQLVGKKSIQNLHWSVITPWVVAILSLTTFLWYSQITAVSGGLVTTLKQSAQNIPSLLSDDNKSTDTSAALLFSNQKTQVDLYESYLQNSQLNSEVLRAKYEPTVASDNIPLTSSGQWLESLGVDTAFTTTLRQYYAKLLQLLAVVGTLFVAFLYIRRKPTLPLDLVGLSIASIVAMTSMVILPNISVDYGILRAFQQMLIFLVVPIVVFLAFATRRISPRLKLWLATAGITALLLLFTGFIAQLLGGVGAGLNLNNRGLYYGLYYATKSDQQTFAWMKQHIPPHKKVRAASFARARMHDPSYPFGDTGILPSQRPNDSYVFLDHAQEVRQLFYVYHQSSPLITTFPLNYYHEQTDKIYSTGRTGVYR